MMKRYIKHPSAIRAYPIDVQGLGSNTIGVISGAVTVGDVVVNSVTLSGSSRVIALISGGTAGVLSQVEVTINISNGEKLIHEFEISVENP